VDAARESSLALLTDSVEEEPEDLLQHGAVADSIANAIWATSPDKPLGIAIYGSWGQGKTTVGALVRQRLEQLASSNRRKVAFIRIEAWKYAAQEDPEPLRRHFLLQAYQAVGMADLAAQLRKRFTQVSTTDELTFSRSDVSESLKRTYAFVKSADFRRSRGVQSAFVLALVIVFVPRVRHDLGSVAASVIAVFLAISAILAFLATVASKLVAAGLTVRTETDPFRSVEEFEEQFHQFVSTDAKDYDRLVFFIDDLDRCPDHLTVEALTTLQAFFGHPRCVYVVAADERQLKRAVRLRSPGPATALLEGRGIPADETFLEKIFQVVVYLPPLYYENLALYATRLAQRTLISSFDPGDRELTLSYLVHPEISTPRQVKAVLNEFLLTWTQARAREAEEDTHLNHDPLTGDPGFLAKMVVLRAHFPWFYELLRFDPQFVQSWPDAYDMQIDGVALDDEEARAISVVGDAAATAAQEVLSFASEPSDPRAERTNAAAERLLVALRSYLTRTSDVVTADAARVQEFVFLRSREIFAGLTGAAGAAYRRGIANGDARLLEDALRQDRRQAVAAANLAAGQAEAGFGVERTRALDALAFLVTRLNEAELGEIGPVATMTLFG
jgi:Cdc6-like AAA superfamily ATPase